MTKNKIILYFFLFFDMLSMLPITYSKYSNRKNSHLKPSSNNRISGNAFYVVAVKNSATLHNALSLAFMHLHLSVSLSETD